MVIPGLRSYMRRNEFLTHYELRNRRVIIEGSSLVRHFHNRKLNATFPGSDYSQYARYCRQFFMTLQQCGVRAFVVFDGGHITVDRSLSKRLERQQHTINKLKDENYGKCPPFCREVLIDILVELQVPHVCTVYRANTEIAVLANKWKCLVMSNDSDFFIYPLEAGCIQIPFIRYSAQVLVTSIETMFYQYKDFLKAKDISVELLPLWATLMSNYNEDISIFLQRLYTEKEWHDKAKRPDDILDWIKTFRNSPNVTKRVIYEALIGDNLTNNITAFKNAIAEYCLHEFAYFDLDKYFMTSFNQVSLVDYYDNPLPKWFTDDLLSCRLGGSFILEAICTHRVALICCWENLELPSATVCSRYIRRLIYGIAVASADTGTIAIHFSEHDRKGDKVWPFVVLPVREIKYFGALPDLRKITDMDVGHRQRLLLACFGLNPGHLNDMDITDAIIPTILSFAFWFKLALPPVNEKHIDALLMCIFHLHLQLFAFKDKCRMVSSSIQQACKEMGENELKYLQNRLYKNYCKVPDKGWDKTTLHTFVQFQECCKDTLRLNKVLGKPFNMISPVVCFNYKFAYNLYLDLQRNRLPVESVCGYGMQRSKLLPVFKYIKRQIISLSNSLTI